MSLPRLSLLATTLISAATRIVGAQTFPDFRAHTISDEVPAAYCVRAADVDGDGRPDVIAQGREVAWFRNPDWTRFPITSETEGNIFVAPRDLDGDGSIEIVLASDFGLRDSRAGGTLTLLRRGPSLTEPWSGRVIGAEPTAHRLFWARIDDEPVLLVSPILGPGASGPAYDQARAGLFLYHPPEDLEDDWRVELTAVGPVVHAIEPVDFDGDGSDEVLIASYLGVTVIDRLGEAENGAVSWGRSEVAEGYQNEPAPRRGASEVALGRLPSGRILVTTEPWHGNQVVVYRPRGESEAWSRQVIDEDLVFSHALAVADFDGDGSDEIVAGFRGEGTSIWAWDALDDGGASWEKHVIDDGGIAAQRIEAVDLDGDGDLDLIAAGGSTHNVKWYENLSR